MIVIDFLVFLVKVLALVFAIGFLINLILDAVIIQPIENRIVHRKRLQLIDAIIEKERSGENVTKDTIEEIEEEIED